MESGSEPCRVHASAPFAALLREQWPDARLESRGTHAVKGKGLMETFWIEAPLGFKIHTQLGSGCQDPIAE